MSQLFKKSSCGDRKSLLFWKERDKFISTAYFFFFSNTVIAPPIQCELSISTRTFLNNYDVRNRNLYLGVTDSTTWKRDKKHWIYFCGDYLSPLTFYLKITFFQLGRRSRRVESHRQGTGFPSTNDRSQFRLFSRLHAAEISDPANQQKQNGRQIGIRRGRLGLPVLLSQAESLVDKLQRLCGKIARRWG